MSLFSDLKRTAQERGLEFLVIGGYAVAAHGYARTTRDADIVICRDARDAWLAALELLDYRQWFDGGGFLQFKCERPDALPLDVMLVNAETFVKLRATRAPAVIGGADVHVPGLLSLLAMKLHALKHGGMVRQFADLDDVLNLMHIKHVDPRRQDIRELFDRHGTEEHYQRVLQGLT